MRQNTRRPPHEKRNPPNADLRVAAGGQLNLGMVVSVYHPGGTTAPDEAAASFLLNDSSPNVTEH